jgi:ribosomal protein S18 acetylase RimI-like enzyme
MSPYWIKSFLTLWLDIELNVWEFNRGAMAFYRQLGYRTTSRKMSKRLGG